MSVQPGAVTVISQCAVGAHVEGADGMVLALGRMDVYRLCVYAFYLYPLSSLKGKQGVPVYHSTSSTRAWDTLVA